MVGKTTTTVQVSPDLPAGVLVRGRIVVHAGPKDRLAALGPSKTSSEIGKEVVLVRGAGGIKTGDVLTIADQFHRSYHRVSSVVDPRVAFDPAVDELLFDSASISPTVSVDVEGRTGGPSGTFAVAVAGDWRRLATRSSPIRARSPPPLAAALHDQLGGLHAGDRHHGRADAARRCCA
jgi:hypothetical protein